MWSSGRVTFRSFVLVVLACLGCKTPATAPDAGPAKSDGPTRPDDEVKPVYTAEYSSQPLARKFCHVVNGLIQERRLACCGDSSPGVMESECARMLSQAVTDKVVTIDEAALTSCETALTQSLEGCDWPGPSVELPEGCLELVIGTLAEKARCRSSLECSKGLRCVGVGPTDRGRCAPPSPEGTLCAISVDALASAARQRLDDAHPECAGICGRRRCENSLDAGVACTTNLECGANRHCAGAAGCATGPWAQEGQPCVQGACGVGLRCLVGTCRKPAPKGAACKNDGECLGGCLRDGGQGRCGPRCDTR